MTSNDDSWREDSWIDKCMKCKHCYTTRDDDYIKCRLRKGDCRFEYYREGTNNADDKRRDH